MRRPSAKGMAQLELVKGLVNRGRTSVHVPRQVNIYEAKTHFSQLVDEVARGETIVVARNNVPIVEMRPIARPREAIVAQFAAIRERVRRENDGKPLLRPGETWRQFIDDGRRR
jgi:prevent-host-death family protein